jgi:hypothetical protein
MSDSKSIRLPDRVVSESCSGTRSVHIPCHIIPSHKYVGIELNPEYFAMSAKHTREDAPLFWQGEPL